MIKHNGIDKSPQIESSEGAAYGTLHATSRLVSAGCKNFWAKRGMSPNSEEYDLYQARRAAHRGKKGAKR